MRLLLTRGQTLHQNEGPFEGGRGFAAELAKIKAALPRGTPIGVWFQDEALIGQKNKNWRWAKRGSRPSAHKEQRTKSAYILSAICRELSNGAGLILPFCNTQTMSLHLAEMSLAIEPGAHGVVLMGQVGWHMAENLEVPEHHSTAAEMPRIQSGLKYLAVYA